MRIFPRRNHALVALGLVASVVLAACAPGTGLGSVPNVTAVEVVPVEPQPADPEPSFEPEPEAEASTDSVVPEYVGTEIRLGTPPGAGAIAIAGLLRHANPELMTGNVTDGDAPIPINTYDITVASAPDELTAELALGRLDAALLPVNLAATLYNRTGGAVQLAAITGEGMIYGVSANHDLTSFADLCDKDIYLTGQGATPEVVINYFTERDLTDCSLGNVNFSSEPVVALQQVLANAGPTAIGVLPEPFVTTALNQNAELAVVLDFNEMWQEATGSPLLTTALVVRTEFAEENPAAVSDLILDVRQSTLWANDDPAFAAGIVTEAGIFPNAEIAAQAIPRANLVNIFGTEAEAAVIPLLTVLYEANPESVGGAIPGDDFIFPAYELGPLD